MFFVSLTGLENNYRKGTPCVWFRTCKLSNNSNSEDRTTNLAAHLLHSDRILAMQRSITTLTPKHILNNLCTRLIAFFQCLYQK